jgi:uncharacterized protein YdeI (BOF family)
MKKTVIVLAIVMLVGISIWYTVGGSGGKNNSFGAGVQSAITSIGDIQKDPAKYLNQVVTVEGEMTKECPTSGCWWYIKDQSGEIRADSAGSGFALPLNRQGQTIRTTGKVVKTESGDLELVAMGAELL